MRIRNLYDFDFRDTIPIYTACTDNRHVRQRVVGRDEEKSIRMIEVYGKLSFSIPGQSMAP
jgi:hypothetical protein